MKFIINFSSKKIEKLELTKTQLQIEKKIVNAHDY